MLTSVGRVDDFEDGLPRVVVAGGRRIVIIRWRQEFFALRDVCPHQQASFEGAKVLPPLEGAGEPGALRVNHDQPVIYCPFHTYPFRLRDGVCAIDPRLRVRTYDVVQEGSELLVRTEQGSSR